MEPNKVHFDQPLSLCIETVDSEILGNILVLAISFPFPSLNRDSSGKYTPTVDLMCHLLRIQ